MDCKEVRVNMGFNVEFGNILDYAADAIVMPANPEPIVGNGLDKLIYHKAGRNRLLKARRDYFSITKVVTVVVTNGIGGNQMN